MVGRSVAAAIVAQAVRSQRSFLGWILIDVPGVSGLMIAFAAVLSFALTLILVCRGRGHLVGPRWSLHFVVSLIGALDALG